MKKNESVYMRRRESNNPYLSEKIANRANALQKSMDNRFTKDETTNDFISPSIIKRCIPSRMRPEKDWDNICNAIANLVSDEELGAVYRNNLIGLSDVLKGTVGVTVYDYLDAVRYVTLKVIGETSTDAYAKTFPDRCAKKSREIISRAATAYQRTQLVLTMLEQTLIPTYILNAPLHQEALNTLAGMIRSDNVKGMAKVKACEVILSYTKAPEIQKSEVKIHLEQNSAIDALREATEAFANTLAKSVRSGEKSLEAANEVKVIDVTNTDDSDIYEGANVYESTNTELATAEDIEELIGKPLDDTNSNEDASQSLDDTTVEECAEIDEIERNEGEVENHTGEGDKMQSRRSESISGGLITSKVEVKIRKKHERGIRETLRRRGSENKAVNKLDAYSKALDDLESRDGSGE